MQVQPGGSLPPVIVKPGGIGSTKNTPVASFGPLFSTTMVNVTVWPATAGAGVTVLPMARSAPALTPTSTLSALFDASGSGVPVGVTSALFTSDPLEAVACAWNVYVAVWPAGSVPANVPLGPLKVHPVPLAL